MSKTGRLVFVAPAVLATAPAFAAALGNFGEFTTPQLFATVAVLLAAGALVHLFVRLLLRRCSATIASLVACVVVAFLFLTSVDATSIGVVARNALLVALGAATAAAIWWLLRRADEVPQWAGAVGTFAVALSALGIGRVALAEWRVRRLVDASPTARSLRLPPPAAAATPRSNRPDVYLIVLDNVANAQVQAEVFGRSNAKFQDSLAKLGFVIPSSTRSNYSYTSHSVTSLLSLGHLRGLESDLGSASTDRAVLYRIAQRNEAARWLHALGYTVYFQPSVGFAGTATLDTPHESYGSGGASAIAAAYARNELLRTAARRTLPGRLLTRWGLIRDVYAPRLEALETVASVAGRPSPKFVLAHSLAAHEWFVFDASCHQFPREELEAHQSDAGYVQSVECTERLVLDAVTRILRDSRTPPVILLQADHGSMSLHPPVDEAAESIRPEQARERMGALGAYYLPGVPASQVPDLMTPVNVLRFVFEHYLGARLPQLPDSSFYTTYPRPFHFVNVTPYLDSTGKSLANAGVPGPD